MEALAAKAALAVGAEAIKLLNRWLENEDTARAWFGKDNRVFVGLSKSSLWQKLKLRKVFVINKEDWEQVITLCLPGCQSWYSQRHNGRCSWLPIYRTVTTGSKSTEFIQNAQAATFSIGTVASLPAACLDKWGLVVLASADGGTARLLENGQGSYRAIFEGRDFTLVISQESLNSMTIAHISPKQHPSNSIYRRNEAEWKNLQNYGRSLEFNDLILQWFGNPCVTGDPPPGLVDRNGTMDGSIKRAIFDHQFADEIGDHLRTALYECHDLWERLERTSTANPPIQGSQFILQNANMMKRNLLRMRMLLHTKSWNPFCEEMTPDDVLRYAEQQYRCCTEQVNNFVNNANINDLCRHHARVFAYQKILHLSSIIPQQLSTKGTDAKVLLV